MTEINKFKKLLKENPNDPETHFKLGNEYRRLSYFQQAKPVIATGTKTIKEFIDDPKGSIPMLTASFLEKASTRSNITVLDKKPLVKKSPHTSPTNPDLD